MRRLTAAAVDLAETLQSGFEITEHDPWPDAKVEGTPAIEITHPMYLASVFVYIADDNYIVESRVESTESDVNSFDDGPVDAIECAFDIFVAWLADCAWARTVEKHPDPELSRCQDCQKTWSDFELVTPIPDIFERVAPGEPMPSGECPNCGSLCQPLR